MRRWLPVALMMLVSTISYVDRNTLALLAPTILHETHLSNQQYGWIISAFSVAYMLANPVWGRILDHIGVRIGMAVSVTVWTLASIAHAFMSTFLGFAAVRALLGLGEAATFPGCLRTTVQTLPRELRSRGVALSYSGGSIGAIIAPLIVTPLAAMWSWRAAFWFTGIIGAAWLIVWAIFSSRSQTPDAPDPAAPSAKIPWSDRRLWAFLSADALGGFPQALVLYWAANYLFSALGKNQSQIGKVLWIPPLGWEAGYFFWGWITDRFLDAGHSLPGLRKMFLLLMVLSFTVLAIPHVHSFPLTMAMMFIEMFVTAGFIICSTGYATARFPDDAGLVGGLGAGSTAALVAIAMPILGHLFDLHLYTLAFLLASAFPVAGVAGWIFLSRESPAPQSPPQPQPA